MFNPGEIVPSRRAISVAKGLNVDLMGLLTQHCLGAWPDITETERKLNLAGVDNNRMVYSRYKINGSVFLITTDLRNSKTTISMAEEFKWNR